MAVLGLGVCSGDGWLSPPPRPRNILILRRSLLILKLDNFSCTFSCSQKVKPFPKTIFKSASFVVFG